MAAGVDRPHRGSRPIRRRLLNCQVMLLLGIVEDVLDCMTVAPTVYVKIPVNRYDRPNVQ